MSVSDSPEGTDNRIGGAVPDNGNIPALSVDALIERFGGIRPMAAKLDVPVTTVQGWKERAAIPERRWPEIVAAAERHGIALGSNVAGAPIERPATTSDEDSGGSVGAQRTVPPDARSRSRSNRPFWLVGILVAALAIFLIGRPALKEKWNAIFSRHPAATEAAGSSAPAAPVVVSKGEAPAAQPPAPAAQASESDAVLAERIASLEARLAAGDNTAIGALRSENRRLNEEVEQLRARLSMMEQDRASRREEREHAQALVMGLGQLRAALAGPAPYGAPLELIEGTMGKDTKVAAILATLRPYADRGAPTRAMLSQRFETVAADVMHAARPKGDTWQDRITQQIASLVVIRRTGSNASEGSTEAILTHAESALAAGDLATAVAMVEHLTGPALDAAGPWLSDAQARLAADKALLALEARTFAVLIGADGGKAP